MASRRRTVAILNPRAGSGRGPRAWQSLRERLGRALGTEIETAETGWPGHASELARGALASGAELILAIGGDGTFSEVVDGWFDPTSGAPVRPEAQLALLPSGTGGDFRKSAGLESLDRAERTVVDGVPLAVDVGRLDYLDHHGQPRRRHFVNIGGFGIGGLVDTYVNEIPFGVKSRLGGKLSFLYAAGRAQVAYRNQRVRLSYDGEPPFETVVNHVAVANGQYFGGGMWVAPRARLCDGLLDVVAMGEFTLLEFLRYGDRIYKGTHLELPYVTFRRARRLEAWPVGDTPVLLEIDGEAPGRLPATFEIVPAAVNLLVPAHVAEAEQKATGSAGGQAHSTGAALGQ